MTQIHSREKMPVEKPLRFFVNDVELVTLMAGPTALFELAHGWLWANNLIASPTDVEESLIDADRAIIWVKIRGSLPEKFLPTISSGCGGGQLIADLTGKIPAVTDGLTISINGLGALATEMEKQAEVYKKTGGVHGAALADTRKLIYSAEDIGRHNAVDKVLGWALINGESFDDKVLLTTGRISSELLFKVAKAGISIVASRTAATDLAVDLAQTAGVTIVGYLRKRNGVIYCHERRISV